MKKREEGEIAHDLQVVDVLKMQVHGRIMFLALVCFLFS